MTTIFDGGADAIVARAKADATVRESVERLRALRYSADPEQFERLLWLTVAQGTCLGATLAISDMQGEVANGDA